MNLKARLDETLAEISGKSSLADAIRYIPLAVDDPLHHGRAAGDLQQRC